MKTTGFDDSIFPNRLVHDYLTNAGDRDAVGDYSGAETIFAYDVAASMGLTRFTAEIAWVGKSDVLYYGPVEGTPPAAPGLVNGVRFRIVRANGEISALDAGWPIKTNIDLVEVGTETGALQGDPETTKNDQGVLTMALYLDKLARKMELHLGDRVEAVLNDDFTSLLQHRFAVAGYLHHLPET